MAKFKEDINIDGSGYFDKDLEVLGLSNQAGIYSIENGVIRVSNPKGGALRQGNSTGAIKITLPDLWTTSMVDIIVNLHGWNVAGNARVRVSGYLPPSAWGQPKSEIISENDFYNDINIRFGHDGTNACIWIGEIDTYWGYITTVIPELFVHQSAYDKRWAENWNISLVTAFDTVQVTKTNNFIWGDWDKLKGKPTNLALTSDIPTDYVDLTTAQAIQGLKRFADNIKIGSDGGGQKIYQGGDGLYLGDSNMQQFLHEGAKIRKSSGSKHTIFHSGNLRSNSENDSRYPILGSSSTYHDKAISIDLNNATDAFFYASSNSINRPFDNNSTVISVRGLSGYGFQLGGRNEDFGYRAVENDVWTPWRRIWNDGNFNPDNKVNKSGDTMTGTLTAPDFIGSSDRRLKENIETLIPNDVKGKYKTFNFKNNKQPRVGRIAQELEETNPEFVRTDDKGLLSISYIDLHSAEIAYLKAQNEAKDEKISKMEERLERLEKLLS